MRLSNLSQGKGLFTFKVWSRLPIFFFLWQIFTCEIQSFQWESTWSGILSEGNIFSLYIFHNRFKLAMQIWFDLLPFSWIRMKEITANLCTYNC